VAKTGVEYYVIDCGWHNDEDSRGIYNYVGQWRESHTRFPSSVRATTDFIRSLGMKAGLWIEPEVIGHKCEEMLNYYTDDCFIRRNGKRVFTMGRYFLDYRHPKVIEYMTETIRRMVEDYGAEYIKFDYNQDLGVGGEGDAYSLGEGLELSAHAFIKWVNAMTERFPHVVFEGCASGGMRMDYKTLSAFSLISTSDQIDYLKYPYIAGNILSAVLPEQAAVWSYPVGYCKPEEITDDQIVFNMVNSLLGRMHLASHLEYMTEEQFKLVKEGILVYNSISDFKKTALPYFPCGLTKFGDDTVVAGLKNGSTAYLAAWCIGEKEIRIPIRAKNASVLYPSLPNTEIKVSENEIILSFEREKTAAFIKLEIKE